MIDDLPKLVLDPANEGDIINLTYERIQEASGNTITDFRPGSAVAALVEGQSFAIAELLYYMNLMPEAIAIEVFRLYGVQRSMGTRATGRLTVVIDEFAIEPYTIPAGYSFPYLATSVTFTETLIIPTGSQEADVSAVIDSIGSQYNLESFEIVATNVGLSLVQSIFNRAPFTGGSDLEPIPDLIKRCQAATVSRSAIITALDYETAAQNILGVNSRALAVANVAADGFSYKQASVAMFLLDASGKPASLATCQAVAADLKTRILIGTAVACFPAVLTPVTVELTINVGTVSEEVAQNAIRNVYNYLRPNTYNGGSSILHHEIAYRARLAAGVLSVDSVIINGDPVDLLLTQPWHYPDPQNIAIYQIDRSGATLTTVRSFGEYFFDDADELEELGDL